MIVRDLFQKTDVVRVVAKAIFEDRWKESAVDGWITKYYAQFTQMKDIRVRSSEYMLYFSVGEEENQYYGDVGGFYYPDIKGNNPVCYSITAMGMRKYASLYIPDHTIQVYGVETVASEVLREYGWNGYDDKYVCPEETRAKIREFYKTLKHELFLPKEGYRETCLEEFSKYMRRKKKH